MNEDAFNMSVRKFLKKVGVTAQREIEQAVRDAAAGGKLKSGDNLRNLKSIRAQSTEPEKIDRFLEIVEEDLGYHLHQSVQQTKVALSSQEVAQFAFTDISTDIRRNVDRSEFESWIAADLREIEKCLHQVLKLAEVPAARIDRVFLTGGSSLLPAVRRTFGSTFGDSKVSSGDEFTSVAKGLAFIPRDRH